MCIDSIVEAWTEGLHQSVYSTAPHILSCSYCEEKASENWGYWIFVDYSDKHQFCSEYCLSNWYEDEGRELEEDYNFEKEALHGVCINDTHSDSTIHHVERKE